MAATNHSMKSVSPWRANAAVCAPAFIKPRIIGQSCSRTVNNVNLSVIPAMIQFARSVVADDWAFYQHDAWQKAIRARSLFAESSPADFATRLKKLSSSRFSK
jgi:hypothetical protein